MPLQNVFISDKTFSDAKAIQAAAANGTLDDVDAELTAASRALSGPWSDINRTFLALQTLNLLHVNSKTRQKTLAAKGVFKVLIDENIRAFAATKGPNDQIRQIEIMLGFNVASTDDPQFVSEDRVLTVINFRRSFEQLIEWPAAIAYVAPAALPSAFWCAYPT